MTSSDFTEFQPPAQPDYHGPLFSHLNYAQWKEYLEYFLQEGERRYPHAFLRARAPSSLSSAHSDRIIKMIYDNLSVYLKEKQMRALSDSSAVLAKDKKIARTMIDNLRKEISKMPVTVHNLLRLGRRDDPDPISEINGSLDRLEFLLREQRWPQAQKGRPKIDRQVYFISSNRKIFSRCLGVKFPKTFARVGSNVDEREEFYNSKLEFLFFFVKAMDPKVERSQVESALRKFEKMKK